MHGSTNAAACPCEPAPHHLLPCCFAVVSFRGMRAAGGIIRAASLASGGRPSDIDEARWLRNFLKARQVPLACAAAHVPVVCPRCCQQLTESQAGRSPASLCLCGAHDAWC
jgi:hypothetical protein